MNVHPRSGFTLIELLVVIAIIGILSGVVLASLNSARIKGRDARRISDMKQVQLALELYYDTNQAYPAVATPQPIATSTTELSGLISSGYISSFPADPSNGTYLYASLDTATTNACTSGICSSYVIRAVIEGGTSAVPIGDVDGADVGGVDCDDSGGNFCVRP